MRMRNLLSGLLLATVLTSTSVGCAGWWTDFKNNPAAQVASVVDTIHTIINIADVLFGQIKPNLPTALQADAQAAFDTAVMAVNHSIGILQAAVQTAVDQVSGLDLSKFFADATKAATELQNLINDLRSKQTTTATVGFTLQNRDVTELSTQIQLLARQAK